jgi:hypothetical protein
MRVGSPRMRRSAWSQATLIPSPYGQAGIIHEGEYDMRKAVVMFLLCLIGSWRYLSMRRSFA